MSRGPCAWLFVAGLLLLATPCAAQTRNPKFWPFLASSPFNTPIGSGAQYSAPTSPQTLALRNAHAFTYNAGLWSVPVYIAATTDPIQTVTGANNGHTAVFSVNVPTGAKPDPSSDAHMIIIDARHSTSLELYGAVVNANGSIDAVDAAQVDILGSGWVRGINYWYPVSDHAAGASGLGGLIRTGEVTALSIPHALQLALSQNLAKKGPVWPADREDYCAFLNTASCYTGSIPMGSLMALVPNVNVATLGLSPMGLAVATALQNYGAYFTMTAGTNQVAIYLEDGAAGMPQLRYLYDDLWKLLPYLAVVMNNAPTSVGGGGTPRVSVSAGLTTAPVVCGAARGQALPAPPVGGLPLCLSGLGLSRSNPYGNQVDGTKPWSWTCTSGAVAISCATQ